MSGPALPGVRPSSRFFRPREWEDPESRGQESSEGEEKDGWWNGRKKEEKERKNGRRGGGRVIKSKWRKGVCNEWGSRYRGNRFILRSIYPPLPSFPRKNINYTEIGSIAYKVTNVERRIVNDFPNNTESLKEFHSDGGRRKGGGGESS